MAYENFETDSRVLSRFLNRRPKNVNRRLQLRPARGEHEARRGVRGHAPPENFYILCLQRCDFLHSGAKIIAFRLLDLLDKNNSFLSKNETIRCN